MEEVKTILINPKSLEIVNHNINGGVSRDTPIIVNDCRLGAGVLGYELHGSNANEKLTIAIKYHESMIDDEFRDKVLNADEDIYLNGVGKYV
ncbi:hypothetical protein [Listeria newyorkensis]|uniref:Uncharacterized protein n=1 Tax=Listeria newyorkensis TaxID=1497681 RepID=A0A841Z144_9LIST|nr:hypothetical protein [Listeria newyorkensis]MBC1459059.1 hypothetical protein [Listeria newyorkensis]